MRFLLAAWMVMISAASAAEPERPKDQRDRHDDRPAAKPQPRPTPAFFLRPGAISTWSPAMYGSVTGSYLWVGPAYPPLCGPSVGGWGWSPLYSPSEPFFVPQIPNRFADAQPFAPPDAEAARNREALANRRATNAEAVALGQRFMHTGDEYFRNGRYSLAMDRYRSAAQASPRVADVYFRQGFALIALGRFESAAKAIKRGLDLQPEWPRSPFRLTDLYGEREKEKGAHLEAIAKTADAKGATSDLLFLIGLSLYFDGKPDRASPFFQRAGQLAGGNTTYLDAFLAARHADDDD